MRTLVYYYTREDTVTLHTYSSEYGRTHGFILPRPKIGASRDRTVIEKDLGSFAELRTLRTPETDLLQVDFTWVSEVNRFGLGEARLERIRIPLHFLDAVGVYGKTLSIDPCMPRIEFHSRKNLTDVAASPYVRRQLSKYLRTAFSWPDTVTIRIYDDFTPYSFYFESDYIAGGRGIRGGLIYHKNEDGTGFYSMHT